MSNLKNKLQHLVEGQIPEFLRVSYPRFASFIKEYYTFLDENRQVNAILLNSNTWTDVDLTLDLFANEMRRQYAYDISQDALIEERRLIKFINQYYEAKGTENAAELFFRMMYNDSATIKYPGEFVLRASDGIWYSKKNIKIDTNFSPNILNPSALALAPADIREDANDVFSLKEKTIYLKYYRREPEGVKLYSIEVGCVEVGKIITNQDIFELEIDVPRTSNVDTLNELLSTQPFLDTVWVTAFDDDVEYVYGFLTQQLIGYNIISGGEGFRLRDTFTVEVEETPFYPIIAQQNNNGIVRVTNVTSTAVEQYFATDYLAPGTEYVASNRNGIINKFNFISTGHRFDITGDYFAEEFMEDDSYTTYKDFTRTFENPRTSVVSTQITGDYFEEREGVTAYMETNDETGYVDFNESLVNLSTASIEFQVGYVYQHSGEWKTSAGFVSDVNKLQDNYYYQAYSYVIQTRNVPYETWNTLYKTSAHPAGFAVFGELLIEHDITFTPIDITSTQFIINNFTDNVQPVDALEKFVIKPLEDFISVGDSYAPDYFLEIYTENEDFTYDFNKVLEDSVGVDDLTGLSLNAQPVFGDAVLTSEILAKNVTLPSISDSVIIIDNAILELTYNREFDDNILANDTQTITVESVFNEVVTVEDASVFNLGKTQILETLVTSETAVKDIGLVFDFIDTYSPTYFAEDYVNENVITINEQVSIQPNYGLTENNQVSDEVTSSFGKNITENLTILEQQNILLEKTFSETIQILDASSINFVVDYAETVTIDDDDVNFVITVFQQDATSVEDSIETILNKNVSVENILISDIVNKIIETSKTDTLTIFDVSTSNVEKLFSEVVNTSDDTVNAITKILSENASVVDVLNIEQTFAVSDSFTQIDDNIKNVNKVIVSVYNNDDYFECPTYAGDDILTLTDTILLSVDNYVAEGYVDMGYAGEFSENTDVSSQC